MTLHARLAKPDSQLILYKINYVEAIDDMWKVFHFNNLYMFLCTVKPLNNAEKFALYFLGKNCGEILRYFSKLRLKAMIPKNWGIITDHFSRISEKSVTRTCFREFPKVLQSKMFLIFLRDCYEGV